MAITKNMTTLKKMLIDMEKRPRLAPKNIPVSAYVQEAANLYRLASDDREALEGMGLSPASINQLNERLELLAEAEADWNNVKRSRSSGRVRFDLKWREAEAFMSDLRHHFHYAYRNDPELKKRLSALFAGRSQAAVIQNLYNLAVFGQRNSCPLAAVFFDMKLLERAADLSEELASLLAEAKLSQREKSDAKKLRDLAYSYLKQIVDEVKNCGRYVFRKDSLRRKGYASAYLRERNEKQSLRKAGERRRAREETANIPVKIEEKHPALPPGYPGTAAFSRGDLPGPPPPF